MLRRLDGQGWLRGVEDLELPQFCLDLRGLLLVAYSLQDLDSRCVRILYLCVCCRAGEARSTVTIEGRTSVPNLNGGDLASTGVRDRGTRAEGHHLVNPVETTITADTQLALAA